jgi:hypothetical protein
VPRYKYLIRLLSDWVADLNYAYILKEEVTKGGKVTGKTSRLVMIDGSDYYLPPAPEREDLQKLPGRSAPSRGGEPASAPPAHRAFYPGPRRKRWTITLPGFFPQRRRKDRRQV